MQRITRIAAISLLLLVPTLFTLSPPLQAQTANPSPDPRTKAIEMNFSAINLAKLAQTRTKNPNVRAFADAMVKTHSHELTQLRKEYGLENSEIRVSTTHQEAADRLAKLSGADFDSEFTKQTVADYQDTVNFLEIQGKEPDNAFAKTARDLKSKAVEDLLAAENLRQALAMGTAASQKGNVYSDLGTAPSPSSPATPPAAAPSTNGGGPIP